jgi:hypothetical protein
VTDELPYAVTDELPYAVTDELSYALTDELSYALTDELPYAVTDELSYAVTDELPHAVTDELSYALTDELPYAVTDELPHAIIRPSFISIVPDDTTNSPTRFLHSSIVNFSRPASHHSGRGKLLSMLNTQVSTGAEKSYRSFLIGGVNSHAQKFGGSALSAMPNSFKISLWESVFLLISTSPFSRVTPDKNVHI